MTIQPYNPPLPAHLNGHVAQDTLTQDEYERFKSALPSWRDRLIAMLLRNTGLRVNDLLGLQVRDLALDGPAFIVYVKRSKKGNTTEYDPIYINPDLGVQLRDYIKGNHYSLMEQLFGGGRGRRIGGR